MTPASAYQVLQQARCRYSKRELAAILEVNPSTFRRWEVNEEIPPYRVDAIRQRILPLISAPANDDYAFTFIDLFAGIGGIRHAFEQHGRHCVFTSEWNSFAQKTYLVNFKAAVVPMMASVAKCIVDKLDFRGGVAMNGSNVPAGAFSGKNWTRKQLKLAFYFYCQTPFGQLHGRNPKVIELAKLISRTPSALAMKCVNFASLDPAIRSSGRSGLSNASRLDREIWDEFHADWELLAVECTRLYRHLEYEHGVRSAPLDEVLATDFDLADYTGETRKAFAYLRMKQEFFRRAVLSSYRSQCCISGVTESRLLVASHIVPWREDKSNRLNPSNGLCLSSIHDKAFDSHLFSLTDDYKVVLSKQLRNTKDTFLQEIFRPIENREIMLPERFQPQASFVRWHREKMLEAEA